MRHSVRKAMQASSTRMRQARKEEVARKSEPQPPVASKSRARRSPESEDDGDDDDDDEDDSRSLPRKAKKTEKPKEFEKISSSAPKRLNDIVQAPPELKKLPRKAKKLAEQGGSQKKERTKSLSEGVLSMAQKAMLEEERERAIRLYREMKKGKTSA
ncbi:hypothetical protein C8Q80DRAFT_1213926 [Daedaleopsis nitida]|nr:hypothetical protein C8Q80DRAFT_1213926 [Daedaleopsis nitida]